MDVASLLSLLTKACGERRALAAAAGGAHFYRGALALHRDALPAALPAGDYAHAATAVGANLGGLQSHATAAKPGGERAHAAAADGAASRRAALGGDASLNSPASGDSGHTSRTERRAARWNRLRSQWSGNGSRDAPNLNQGRRKQRAASQASRPPLGKEIDHSSPGRSKAPPGLGPLPTESSSSDSSRSPAASARSLRQKIWHIKSRIGEVEKEAKLLASST